MKHRFLYMFIEFLLVFSAMGALREISYYCPMPVQKAPVIDGRLDDDCWRTAPVDSAGYEYFKASPGPSELRSSRQMVYTSSGLYLGIRNFEKNPSALRCKEVARDAPHLWKDDCAEIYIDGQPNGAGYHKFVNNAAGVIGDMVRVDASVSLNDWNGTGWQVRTRIEADCWTIEAFFPWDDLGARAAPGSVWRFCHVRYAWTSGRFQGSTSSPGGNYESIGDFGYLFFQGEQKKTDDNRLLAMFSRLVPPPWAVSLGGNVWINTGNGPAKQELTTLLADSEKQAGLVLKKLADSPVALKKDQLLLTERHQRLQQNCNTSLTDYLQWHRWLDDAGQFLWKIRLHHQFN